MNEIKVTVELCDEDRARLDSIEALLKKQPNCDKCVERAIAYVAPTAEKAPAAEEIHTDADAKPSERVDEAPKPEIAAQAENSTPESARALTLDDVRQKVVSLSAAGKKAQVREIVTAYAPSVSGIPEDKLVEVYGKLSELG